SSICNVTLADVAMYFYETDLHPTLDDEVPTTARDRALADEEAFGSNIDTMHQHMSTFVIGFGIEGSFTDEDIPQDFTQSFDWGDPTTSIAKIDDLRHAALNGRGGYLSAANPTELKEALEAAFEEFATASGTASAVSFNSQEITQGSLVFRAFYNVRESTGDLIAQTFDETGQITGTVWSSAEQLDEQNFDTGREIVTYDPLNHRGVPFRPCPPDPDGVDPADGCNENLNDSITAEQFNQLVEFDDGTETQQVTERVNYFRGDASNERPSGNFRERPAEKGRLGDIVNASPIFVGAPEQLRRNNEPFPQDEDLYANFQDEFVGRQEIIYVAANDGMFHGFDAETGREEIAFVPNASILDTFNNKIPELLNFNYTHKYFVDLTPALNDVFMDTLGGSSPDWVTMAIGGFGAGGKGYFAFNGTDPTQFKESTATDLVLWEFTDDDDTYPTDSTGAPLTETDADGNEVQRQDLQT
ncbi:MAG: PilC/PilY family type IV pilus protein, partial [Pseudomonadales bacterium]